VIIYMSRNPFIYNL